jgi:hypothetical protein
VDGTSTPLALVDGSYEPKGIHVISAKNEVLCIETSSQEDCRKRHIQDWIDHVQFAQVLSTILHGDTDRHGWFHERRFGFATHALFFFAAHDSPSPWFVDGIVS